MKSLTKFPIYCSAIAALLLVSCRGEPFQHQPVHVVMNMDQQRRVEAQEKSTFFADNRAMRQPVDGTIARGHLKTNTEYHEGIQEDSNYVTNNPVNVTKSFMYRGQDQFEVYCTPCHGKVGAGNGIIMTGNYNYVPAPSFHTDRLRNMPEGQIYSAIANGVRNMPSYGPQISVRDRWAIVAYVKALQRSQNASEQIVKQMQVSTDSLMAAFQKKQAAEAKKQAAQQKQQETEVSVARGKKLFTQNACGSCHSLDGSKGVGPTLKGLYGHEVTLQNGKTIKANEDYIRESITQPREKIVQGFQPVMPNVSGTLSDADVQSLIEYIKTLK